MTGLHAIHDANRGFNDALSYDTHRPSYPNEAVGGLLANLGIENKAHAKVIDLAAGTGKFTELLVARPEAYDIVAVEPLEPMRLGLEAKKLKGVGVRAGTAKDMGSIEDGWADACVVAQAFHWFATEEALQEMHRVLKPGGHLGLIWNAEDYNQPKSWPATKDWEHELNTLNFSIPPDGQARFRHDEWPQVFVRQANADKPLFSTPLKTQKVPWTVWLTIDGLWNRFSTLSHIAILEGEERKLFREKFDKIVKGGDGEWNDKGEIEVHGRTLFAWATRL